MRYRQMRFAVAVFGLILLALGASSEGARREEPRIVEKVTTLPVALDKDFEFRKTKLFFLSEHSVNGRLRALGRRRARLARKVDMRRARKRRRFRMRRLPLSANTGCSAL